jgi:type IV secretion system protein TrbG
MSKTIWTSASLMALLGGCAVPVKVPEVRLDPPMLRQAEAIPEPKPPVQIVEVPKPLPLPGQLKPLPKRDVVQPDTSTPDERIGAANAAAKVEPTKAGYINAIQVYPYTAGALYQLYAAVNQVTDVALEAGEKLVSVSAGDTVRWVVGDTTSGDGKDAQVHIMVKPIAPDLTTNLVITTDRRTYHLELHATDKTYMASVSWTYPASALLALKAQSARAKDAWATTVETGLDIDSLRFRYRLEGDAPWKPLRVFDDGAKVYIQFPANLKQGDAPPLFVIGGDGTAALVNYRVRGATYIVDRLFAAAELRLGTAPQQVVRIVRTDAVWKERSE